MSYDGHPPKQKNIETVFHVEDDVCIHNFDVFRVTYVNLR